MRGVKKHSYKHLDKKNEKGFNNSVIELNMEDLAKMVFNSNHGMHRFISEYSDLYKESNSEYQKEFAEKLVEVIENYY